MNQPTNFSNAQAMPITEFDAPTQNSVEGAETAVDKNGATNSQRVYFPHLDGLRFWAFFAVFLSHSFVSHDPTIQASPVHQFMGKWNTAGTLGVNFFFVLSGFLITYLLLVEYQRCGHIDVRAFWLRRALRIWPLYFACVAVNYLLRPGIEASDRLPPLGYYLAFVPNFLAFKETTLPAGEHYNYGTLGVLWSVGVEEQFYVVWPLLLAAVLGGLILRRPVRQPQWLFAGVCAFSLGFSLYFHNNNGVLYVHTAAVIISMAVGSWASWHCFYSPRFLQWLAFLSHSFIVSVYLTLFVAVLIYVQWLQNGWVAAVERPILAALFAFVILEQCYATNSFYKCGNRRWLSTLGRYTYGLYCLQFFAIIAVEKLMLHVGNPASLWQLFLLQTPLALAVNIVIAALSFHLLEQPFLRLKRRFAHIQTT